ncbi:MAG TPA: sugar phosphate nucleotidyltransferase, partial [Phycisphaerae bacterium]|nr:sugar phosphate nucleotidyltransferase [Phycisphaerae bacterium]
MRYAIIMAGGSGKRLWPCSRTNRPKQLIPMVEGKSLLEIAVERLLGLFEPEKIFIITNRDYADKVCAAIDKLPAENIIGEPSGRDTANAVALAAAIIEGRDPHATMAIFTADHIIRPESCFIEAVELAMKTAEKNPDSLVTFGIRPNWPHTGLGYIECGDTVAPGVHKVESFREKPDHPTARKYVESGRYFWNSGMFVWKVSAIQAALREFLPASAAKFDAVTRAVRKSEDVGPILDKVYPELQKISIDYAVMEKTQGVLMTELNCEWIDLGSWPALENVLDQDDKGNTILAAHHVVMDSFNNIIVSEDESHIIAMLGMDDCIVVQSGNATLVCRRSDSQRLKE